jgi:hypothetical protein
MHFLMVDSKVNRIIKIRLLVHKEKRQSNLDLNNNGKWKEDLKGALVISKISKEQTEQDLQK